MALRTTRATLENAVARLNREIPLKNSHGFMLMRTDGKVKLVRVITLRPWMGFEMTETVLPLSTPHTLELQIDAMIEASRITRKESK
jgi:hypothetical protein